MRRPLPLSAAALALPLFFLLLFSSTADAHNITKILAKHPEFSTFNHYLSITHLAGEINRRLTITVLALDNSAMSDIISKHFTVGTIKNVLSLHVLVDYYGAKKLHQLSKGTTLSSTLFQASGSATGTSGYVNITNLKGGKVGFGSEDNGGDLNSFYVKSVMELPYNISILQISKVITSADAEAPTAAPLSLNLTEILPKQGCKAFNDLLIATGAAETYQSNIDGGLTVFCPTDAALNAFLPKYKNLTAAHKVSLLLYHGMPIYLSLQMLKSNNGVVNTLATDGGAKYDFDIKTDGEDVTVKTKVVTATVTATLIDSEPLIVYELDKVLQPRELFKAVPEEEDEAPAPKAAKKKKTKAPSPTASDGEEEEDADSPIGSDESDGEPEDQKSDKDGAFGSNGQRSIVAMILSLWLSVLLV
ncbi:fasciclin-like arabinogalactan protein 2 [Cucurbita moschata]|uniref:Fasciclin-like arabinogalactan protein 2 n=1 Tax=Cucurbita moschata TaxID=3662 RepID=A0A6J1GLE7_CUCMO|nr:fasciclin-like arabinogalactan protein 2 [Cucurbita moschata]